MARLDESKPRSGSKAHRERVAQAAEDFASLRRNDVQHLTGKALRPLLFRCLRTVLLLAEQYLIRLEQSNPNPHIKE